MATSTPVSTAASVDIVRDGEVRAVVVTADKPSPIAAYAAAELVAHIETATGKRLAVAGALAMRPDYVIFDEATSMLDAEGREDVLVLRVSDSGEPVWERTTDRGGWLDQLAEVERWVERLEAKIRLLQESGEAENDS